MIFCYVLYDYLNLNLLNFFVTTAHNAVIILMSHALMVTCWLN